MGVSCFPVAAVGAKIIVVMVALNRKIRPWLQMNSATEVPIFFVLPVRMGFLLCLFVLNIKRTKSVIFYYI